MTAIITPTRRPLHQRVLDLAAEYFGRGSGRLLDLDRRTLLDIGIDAGQIDAIEAESRGRATAVHLRVVGGAHHR
jgi:hypothetical protein